MRDFDQRGLEADPSGVQQPLRAFDAPDGLRHSVSR